MERLQINRCFDSCLRKNTMGMTLIEVLIALAIISIALTAVIKATTQNIRSTAYLQDKTMALWVGQEVLSEARTGVLRLPSAPDRLKQKTEMLGRDWYWQAGEERTPNKNIKKILVSVFANEEEDDEASPLITLESYVYNEPKN